MIKLLIKTNKAQLSLEFIAALSFLLIIFLFFLSVFQTRYDEFAAKPDEFAAKTLAENVALSINNVFILGNNSTTTIFMPEILYHTSNYSLNIYGESRTVDVMYGDKRYSYPFLTSKINTTLLPKGRFINITNSGGDIHITY